MIRRFDTIEELPLPAESEAGGRREPREAGARDEDRDTAAEAAAANAAEASAGEPEEIDEPAAEVEAAELEAGSEDLSIPPAPEFPVAPTAEDRARLRRALEAILFASMESVTPTRLAEVVGAPIGIVKEELAELARDLDGAQRPYELHEFGGGYRLYVRAEFYPLLLRLRGLRRVERLTPAALETLAIVAYRQPIIRAEVEAIRGVRVGPLLRALLDRKLIRVVGRAEVPGAPLQYGTTPAFLDRFGLKSLDDLPSLKEFKQGRI